MSDDMREQFERWAALQGDSCVRLRCVCGKGCETKYESTFTHWEWKAWQAAYDAGLEAAAKALDNASARWMNSLPMDEVQSLNAKQYAKAIRSMKREG